MLGRQSLDRSIHNEDVYNNSEGLKCDLAV